LNWKLFRSITTVESMETNQDDNSRQVPDNSIVNETNNLVCREDWFEYFLSFFFLKSEEEKQLQERIKKLLTILNGEITIDLHMQFLIKNNHADLLILKQIKVNQKFKIFFFLLFLFIK